MAFRGQWCRVETIVTKRGGNQIKKGQFIGLIFSQSFDTSQKH